MSCDDFDFAIVQNNDRDILLTVLDPDSGDAIDLTGADAITISMFSMTGSTPLFTKTLADGDITLVTAASGIIQMEILPADIATITGKYRLDGKVTDSNGKTFNLRKDVDYNFIIVKILESLV